jgi:hypothetical protein
VIALFIVLQVTLPLGYYLGLRAPSDERFAWRMFSTVHLEQCQVAAWEDVAEAPPASATPRRVDLDQRLHHVWVTELERNQPRVVDRFLESACEDRDAVEVRLVRGCRSADGRERPLEQTRRGCRSPP